MIVIDANVVSELMRTAPDKGVLDWFGCRDAGDLYISAVTEAELRRGVPILPEGRRRDALASAIDAMVAEDFTDRVLAFDGPAAIAFAVVFAERRAIERSDNSSAFPTARSRPLLVPGALRCRRATSRTSKGAGSAS